MKKITFLTAIVLLVINCPGQDYLINFTGSGLSSTVDSVLVINLNRGDSLMMSGADTLHLTSAFGVQHFEVTRNELSIYPNPMSHSSTIDFIKVSSGITTIGIFDVAGKCISKIVKHLPSGRHIFEVSGLKAGMYFVQVNCSDKTFTCRLASAAGQALTPILRYRGTIQDNLSEKKFKSATGIVQMLYFEGERILMKGCSDNHSRVITFVPEQNETIDFEFVECKDADGRHYAIVTIGEQTWMAENLAYLPNVSPPDQGSLSEPYCYVYDYHGNNLEEAKTTQTYQTYGVLFNWPASLDACPEGWRLPTDDEWTVLTEYVSSQSDYLCDSNTNYIAKALAATTNWYSNNITCAVGNNLSANNATGLTGMPGGFRRNDGIFDYISGFGYWWSSTEYSAASVYYRSLDYWSAKVNRSNISKDFGFSVRCLRDETSPPTTYSLNLEANPTVAGTVSGEGQYDAGEQVNLDAEANPGWEFANWMDDDGIVSETANFTYIMPAQDVTLTANFVEEQVGFTCGVSTIMDIDGNVYNTVLIGDQCWMKENLKTTHYRTGTPIVYPGADNNAWQNNTTGAYAWYNNDSSWKDSYGALYNWHAVSNANGLCPTDWYVPSDDEWTQLVNYVIAQGFPNQFDSLNGAGNALKSCRQVNSPLGGDCNTNEHPRWASWYNNHGFDEFGFSGLPGHNRQPNGSFDGVGFYGYWWSSTEEPALVVWSRLLRIMDGGIARSNGSKTIGFSVRCLKDEGLTTTFSLNIEVNPDTAGTVNGAGEYEAGDQVNIAATANPGWEFTEWTGDIDYVDDPNVPNTTVIMPAQNMSLTANFIEEQVGFICGTSTLTDIDGNIYNTVLINNQCWMKENLKTTHYRTGTPIVYPGADNNAWQNNTTGAYAWYNNDSSWKDSYGALYNWYAVNNANGLCPTGWYVPSDDEWTQLVDYIIIQGYPNQSNDPNGAGNALKSCRQVNSPLGGECNTTVHPRWNSHSTHHGFDEFGFAALPGGYRNTNGAVTYLGPYGYWWSSAEYSSSSAWGRYMNRLYGNMTRSFYNKSYGFSVRCLRDETSPPTTYNLNLEVNPTDAGTVSGEGQYEAGEQVNLDAEANPGWEFVNWTDDDGIVSEAANFTYIMPAQDVTLTANFVEEQVGFTCGVSTIIDIDGNVYNTVLIGDQCWMKENLKVGVMINGSQEMSDNGIIEKYCYNDDPSNCDVYGALYQWDEMMNYSTVSGSQGICSSTGGWHIPTDEEWKMLEGAADSQYGYPDPEWDMIGWRGFDVSIRLKATTTWSGNGNGTDDFGFSALAAGGRWEGGGFANLHSMGSFWTSDGGTSKLKRTMYANVIFQNYRQYSIKTYGYSVRCLKSDTIGLPSLTTAGITDITLTTAVGGGNITDQGAHPVTARGVCWSITPNPTLLDPHTLDGAGIGAFVSVLTDLLPTTAYYVRAYATNADGTAYGNQVSFTTTSTGSFECGASTITDIDGNVYNTVLIGDQCWMKENLKVGIMINGSQEMSDNGIIEKYCYNDDPSNCDVYGALYQWDEMMNYSTVSGSQGICPPTGGWHIPTDEEWKMLEGAADSQYGYPDPEWDMIGWRGFDVSIRLKATTTWSGNGNGTDDFGFSALAAGGRWEGGGFANLHSMGSFWTSDGGTSKLIRGMHAEEAEKNYRQYISKEYGYSVRCLMDEMTPPTTYNLNLEVNPTVAGTVSGEGQYEAGEQVNLDAEANPGWEFANWMDDDGIVSETANFTYIMPDQDVTLTANFVEEQTGFTCGDPLIDPREGQSYTTVQIGNQCWMAENLNIGTRIDGSSNQYNNGIIEKYCHNNSEAMCDVYGGLYQWDEMMQYTSTQGVQGICPEGWHIPTDEEWTTLTTYVSSQPEYLCNNNPNWNAKAMAAKTNWNSSSNTCAVGNNISANNATMFTAMGGGYRYSPPPGSFYPIGRYGYWWSSTEFTYFGTEVIWIRYIYYEYANVYPNFYDKYYGFSVRCLQD
jgi:uncharacterized protein (TIGR02145 family)